MGRREADLLMQLAIEGRLRAFIALNPALGKLPGILSNATRPENLARTIRQHDADIGAKSLRVNHLKHPVHDFIVSHSSTVDNQPAINNPG